MPKKTNLVFFKTSEGVIRPSLVGSNLKSIPHKHKKKRNFFKHTVLIMATALISAFVGIRHSQKGQKQSDREHTSIKKILATQSQKKLNNISSPQKTLDTSLGNQQDLPDTNAISNQVFQLVASCAPATTNTNTLWQYTTLLQELSTTNKTCHALHMTLDNITNFVNMVSCIPSNQISNVCSTNASQTTWFSFEPLKNALQTTNAIDITRETFLQKNRYLTQKKLAEKLADPAIEGNESFLYWDNATKVVKTNQSRKTVPNNQPTLYKGINVAAHPEILSHVRFENSDFIQEILHPDDKENRSDASYIYLSTNDLNRLTENVISNGYTNCRAKHFSDTYGLHIHTNDFAYLEEFFNQKVAQAVQASENDLEKNKPTSLANESVLFGSYTNSVPIDAAVTAADIRYNCGQNLRQKWPRFSNAYTKRDFDTARKECIVTKNPNKARNKWRQDNMQRAQLEINRRQDIQQNRAVYQRRNRGTR